MDPPSKKGKKKKRRKEIKKIPARSHGGSGVSHGLGAGASRRVWLGVDRGAQGPRQSLGEEDPRFYRGEPEATHQPLGGRRIPQPLWQEGAGAGRGSGEGGEDPAKSFREGGLRGRAGGERGSPAVCLPRSHRGAAGRRREIPRARSVSSTGIRAAGGCSSGAPRPRAGPPVPPGGAEGSWRPRRQRLPRGCSSAAGRAGRSVSQSSRARWRRLG